MKRQGKIGHLYASPAEEGFYWALSAMDQNPSDERWQQLDAMANYYLWASVKADRLTAESRRRLHNSLAAFAAIAASLALVAWAVLS